MVSKVRAPSLMVTHTLVLKSMASRCSIDGYILQGNSHNASLTPPHSTRTTGYTGIAGYANVSHFSTSGIAGSLNDPYQSHGYGGVL
jgi:hypothetical protein